MVGVLSTKGWALASECLSPLMPKGLLKASKLTKGLPVLLPASRIARNGAQRLASSRCKAAALADAVDQVDPLVPQIGHLWIGGPRAERLHDHLGRPDPLSSY